MKKSSLSNLISLGEGFAAEFKRAGVSNLGREVCAFANATGGVILIGVTDSGKVCGVAGHNDLKSKIQSIARNTEPPIAVEIESVGKVLCVTIPAQHSKPYSFSGKFFIREGANCQQMSREEIREFFYKEGLIRFDETACDKFSLQNDLDKENWPLFQRRAKIPADMRPATALRNLHLIGKDGRITQAGAWLLARDIRKFNINADLACALFAGTDKERILDQRSFHGDVYSMIDDVVTWILSKINVEYVIKHVKREERPELPEGAIREAVVNALAHRDYRAAANVQIYLFQDRLEIVSPGGLPAGMTEAQLGIKSIPRNPLLFSILHRMEVVEKIGSGIQRIRALCHKHGVAKPVFSVSDSWVTTVFPRVVGQVTDQMETQTGANPRSRPESRPESWPESRPGSQLGLRPENLERRVLSLLRQASMARSEISANLGHTSVSGHLKQVIRSLMDNGLIKYTIPEKPNSRLQKYELTKKGRSRRAGLADTE